MRIFVAMKARVNITIEETILERAKIYASKKHLSLSRIIEDYLNNIIQSPKRKNILELVDNLKKSNSISDEKDLKQSYYEEQKGKYGF